MPNIVENKLKVSGNEDCIAQFRGLMGKEFSLEKILPTPQKFLEDKEHSDQPLTFEEGIKKGLPDWYTWRLQHWGTKWDVDNSSLVEDTSEYRNEGGSDKKPSYSLHYMKYEFTSAWHPPLIALVRLSREIPSLKIELEYSEVMNNVHGQCIIEDGETDFSFPENENS